MKKLLSVCLLLAALATSTLTTAYANEPLDELNCKDGVIISGSDRYCAPPPPPIGGLSGTSTTAPDGTLLLIEIGESAWVALSLL